MNKPDDVTARRDDAVVPSKLPFPVVGIGAAGGGLPALQDFFRHMPADSGMAFVVVLHLSPTYESEADRLLQLVTGMPVRRVTGPTPIEANRVYVIPPAMMLRMHDGYLRLLDAPRVEGWRTVIDTFFRTLADAHANQAMGVVLSGGGSDGSVGIARIKERGGVTFAQAPQDAEYDAMPRAAIATGLVDVVLPVAELPDKLLEIWRNIAANIGQRPTDYLDDNATHPPGLRHAEAAIHDILTVLRARTGHDFLHYKRATVLRRIERRMQVNAVPDLRAYAALLHTNTDETPALLSDMLIGVTQFFRDREAFEALARLVVPAMVDRATAGAHELRAWSVGCSSGEEAYSIAMLLARGVDHARAPHKVQVFATDIDERALAIGRAGSYPDAIATDVPPELLQGHFVADGERLRLRQEIRDAVLFAQHNVTRDPPFSRLGLISCRNLLIYLDRDVQAEVLRTFHFALNPGGFLFLGSAESADAVPHLFVPVDKEHRIYRAKEAVTTVSRTTAVSARALRQPAPMALATEPPPRRKVSFAEVHRRVLEQYAPPSVIVDGDANIVHMSDHAGRFLRYVGGEPSYHLPAVVHPALRLDLHTALFQAAHTRRSVEARRVPLARDGRDFHVSMVVRPFHEPDSGRGYLLVLFDEVEAAPARDTQDAMPADDDLAARLETELRHVREQLQLTIEQSEASHEELRASNEELQAMNEELRSATEELETSKEELQSINEELITVNFELKTKVEETGKINDDLQNLIASTDIATVCVDTAMRIKWFTPRALDVFRLIAHDVGRSLLDITHDLDYEGLADDARRACAAVTPIERDVPARDGRRYLLRALPYRTAEARVEGAVLTFIDVSGRRGTAPG